MKQHGAGSRHYVYCFFILEIKKLKKLVISSSVGKLFLPENLPLIKAKSAFMGEEPLAFGAERADFTFFTYISVMKTVSFF
jgi:hypothetical protein